MITISESDACIKVFKKLYKSFTKTGGISTANLKVFFHNNGIKIKFDDVIIDIDGSYDLSAGYSVTNPLFISVILTHFENSHEDISIDFSDGKVKIDDYTFSYEKEGISLTVFTEWHMKFSSEQWNNLEKKFDITLGNYNNPEKLDCIILAVNEGDTFIIEPSYDMVKIEKPEALIETVSLEQSYGHSCNLFSLPKKIWEIFKDSDDDVFLEFYSDETVRIHSHNIQISYHADIIGGKYYAETYLPNRAQDGIDISNIKNAILPLEGLIKNLPEDSDRSGFLIEEGNILYQSDVIGHIENNDKTLSVSMELLISLLKDMDNPKMKRIEADKKYIQIFNDKIWAYFPDSEI